MHTNEESVFEKSYEDVQPSFSIKNCRACTLSAIGRTFATCLPEKQKRERMANRAPRNNTAVAAIPPPPPLCLKSLTLTLTLLYTTASLQSPQRTNTTHNSHTTGTPSNGQPKILLKRPTIATTTTFFLSTCYIFQLPLPWNVHYEWYRTLLYACMHACSPPCLSELVVLVERPVLLRRLLQLPIVLGRDLELLPF